MSKGVNKVIIIGNLGADPEKGTAVKVRIATTDSWKDREGNKQEKTEWHQVTFFGRAGDIAMQYLNKGSQVYVEGSLRTNSYVSKDGSTKYTTEIIANNLQMLSGKRDSNSQYYAESPQHQNPQYQNQNQNQYDGYSESLGNTFTVDNDDEDDLPF